MDITYNKVDQTALPISQDRVSASEYNQIAASLMQIITSAGLTQDGGDNTQLLNAIKSFFGSTVTETYHNGASWYRVWSDGWCEQGGQTPDTDSATQTKTAALYPSFIDTNYFAVGTTVGNGTYAGIDTKTTSSITFYSVVTAGNLKQGVLWYACGYIR